MESEQKYIEDEFELDENFLYQIHAFNPSVKNKIAAQIDTLIGLPATKGLDKLKSGVVHDKDGTPTFFTLS